MKLIRFLKSKQLLDTVKQRMSEEGMPKQEIEEELRIDYVSLAHLFIWSNTEEGHTFWSNIEDEFLNKPKLRS